MNWLVGCVGGGARKEGVRGGGGGEGSARSLFLFLLFLFCFFCLACVEAVFFFVCMPRVSPISRAATESGAFLLLQSRCFLLPELGGKKKKRGGGGERNGAGVESARGGKGSCSVA